MWLNQPGEEHPGTATFNTNYYKLKDCKERDALEKTPVMQLMDIFFFFLKHDVDLFRI